MKDEYWRTVAATFCGAIELPQSRREPYLRRACTGSPDLEREVRRLLVAHELAVDFLEIPALVPPGEPFIETGEQVFRTGENAGGRFEILGLLGVGGMGEVYEAYDSKLRQRVAIKTLRYAPNLDPAVVDRFRSEVLRARQITHPSVGPVYDMFTHIRDDGREVLFFTMKLLVGETLSRWLARRGPLSPDEALPLLEQMASALDAAHGGGIVHRDFKPGNVFISKSADETVHAIVTDFGIASELEGSADSGRLAGAAGPESAFAGTPAYMAPEQLAGEPSTCASDIYALGLTAYEMLLGHPAYDMRSPLVCALRKLAPADPVLFAENAGIPSAWVDAIHRCVVRNPRDRFQSASEFIRAISPKEKVFSRRLLLSRGLWFSIFLAVLLSGAAAFVLGRRAGEPPVSASIAVLPFDNLSGDPQMSYLSDGVAGELSAALTAYPKLYVAAQSAAAGYRSGSASPQKISQTLGVSMLLMGSVGRLNNRLHISVQLIRGATGRQVWSKGYDRDIREVFAVQGEIAAEIAGRLLQGPVVRKSSREPTTNMEAYDLYLKGRHLWNTRTRDGLIKAISYFQQAYRLDETFALAYTALADSYLVLVDYGWMSASDGAPQIRSALRRSLSLDPDSADTQASLGLFDNLIEWDQTGAERAFQKALTLNPSLLNAHFWYANYLMRGGRLDEALREAEAAKRLDPVSLPTLGFLGWVRYYRGDYPAAIEVGRQVLELYPSSGYGHYLLALSFAVSGEASEAIRSAATAASMTSDRAVGLRYRAMTLSLLPGHEQDTRQIAAELETLSQDRQAGYLVIIYAGIRDRERMYYWADRAIQKRDTSLLMANIAPAAARFRNEPRFFEVMRQLGYPR